MELVWGATAGASSVDTARDASRKIEKQRTKWRRWTVLLGLFLIASMRMTSALADSGWCPPDVYPGWQSYSQAESRCINVMMPQTAAQYPSIVITAPCHPCCVDWNNSSHTALIGSWVYGVYSNVAGSGTPDFGVGNQWACPTPIAANPAKGLGAPPPSNATGDPINAGNGNVYRLDQDFDFGRWLKFERVYNSDASAGSGILGPHWTHTYARRLAYAASNSTATVIREDGRVSTYRLIQGKWAGEPDVYDALTEQVDASGHPTGWSLKRVDTRSTEQYDAQGHLIAIQEQEGFTTTLSYSDVSTPNTVAPGPGFLLTVTDPHQRAIQLSYNSGGQLSHVTGPDGNGYDYAYNGNHQLQTISYPGGTTVSYAYDEPDHSSASSLSGLLTGVFDESGNRYVSYTYNAAGQGTNSQFAGGQLSYTLTYNSDGSVDVLDPLGTSRHHTFTTILGVPLAAGVNGICESCSTTASWTYDFRGMLRQTTDYNGNVTTYQHDVEGLENGRVEGANSATPKPVQTDWSHVLHVPSERRIYGTSYNLISRTTWIYNTRGQPLVRCEIDATVSAAASYACAAAGTVPVGVRRWIYTYCDAVDSTQCPLVGLLLSITGPRTDLIQTSTYSYYLTSSTVGCGTPGAACYQVGDLRAVTDSSGHVTTIASYDGAGRVTRIIDANGINTDSTYTPRGWLASYSIAGAATHFTYKPHGAIASVTDPDGVILSYTYDTAHRLIRITDALGNYAQYTLDALGNKTTEQFHDSSGTLRKGLSRNFNALGQLIATVDGMNNIVFSAGFTDSYDANGNLVHSADALGVQRKQGYDALNRLVSTIDNYNGTDTATQNTQSVFAYDTRDQLQGVSDPDGLNTTYDYDGLGNATGVHSPDTGTSTYVYDAAGNRIQAKDARGIISNSTYDALNRIIATTYPDSTSNINYRYDEPDSTTGCVGSYPVGRLTSIVETAVTTTYCYDARGNVVQKRQTQGTNVDTVNYTYTLADRLASTRTPDGTAIQYGRDGAGRINAVTVLPPGTSGAGAGNVVTNISYLPFGPIASYTLGNGQTVTRTYDANYAVTDVVSPALNLHFARDAMGNITALGNAPGANPAIETYSYDPLYRLTSLKDAQGQAIEAYTYNKTGDRLSKTANGLATGAYGYQAGTHRLTSIGSSARTYDANGNTTGSSAAGNTFGYGYNDRNRMSVVQRNGQTVANYIYNAMEERVTKAAVVNQRFVYDESSQLLGEYDVTSRSYIWLGSLPVAIVDTSATASQVSYVHADGLGTPRAISDTEGTAIWQWALSGNPFGEQQPSSGAFTLNFRLPGQYFDLERGSAYNLHRDYEPASGRYLQSDPIGLTGGISTYAYVGGNPVSYIDPEGLAASGGPWHPPSGVRLSCTSADSCGTLEAKMALLQKMINSHQGWDWNNPSPRGGGRHAGEIADLWRAYANCQALYARKCKNCKPAPKSVCSDPIECSNR